MSDSVSEIDRSLSLVVHAAGDLRLEPIAVGPVADGDAVVRVSYGGICGSDLHYWIHGAAGDSLLRGPMVLGHEVVGHVLRPAKDGSGPPAGTPVAVHPATPGSGTSRYPADRPNLAPNSTYLGSAAKYPHTDGAFSALTAVPTRMLRTLPQSLDLKTAALIEPASVAWHAVARAGDVRGKRVMVVGSGPIGALIVAVLRRAGATEIIAVDLHDLPLKLAAALGASRVVKANETSEIESIEADVVIESSGNIHGLHSALAGTTRGGRVVLVGLLPSGDQPVPVSIIISRELEVVGSFRFNDEIDEVIAALADGSLRISSVITHEFPIASAQQAFEVAKDASASGKVLLRF